MCPDDDPPSGQDRLSAERILGTENQAASDGDQTASDEDQTASDRDQMASEEDEVASARDQETADREQAAADLPDSTANAEVARNRAARNATAYDRGVASKMREETAGERETIARTRDATASARDESSHLRDRVAAVRDSEAREHDEGADALLGETLSRLRKQAAQERARAAADRKHAARDREWATKAREQGARERMQAARDRSQAAHDLELAATDPLTGTRARGAGLNELQREIDRARRTTGSLVLAFVDVDHLKRVNDTEGHLAGDRLLAGVATALRDGLRSYDLVMRFGGDEFLCALSGIPVDAVERRFEEIGKALAANANGNSISAGLAELHAGDETPALIARADDALIKARGR